MKTYTLIIKQDTLSKSIAKDIESKLIGILEYDEKQPDLVISVGGDGTVLQSVHQYFHQDCYFVGVHTGTLGFFTDYQKEEIDALIKDIKNNDYKVNERYILEIITHQKERSKTFYALNEVRIDHGFATQVIDVYINDDLLETFRGNGLCVSTPSGSTAYNKSLGGAVIYPGNPLMQLTEVAGIQHNAYRSLGAPLILDDKQSIRLIRKQDDVLHLGVDHLSFSEAAVDSIEIKISKKIVTFIEYKEMSFIKRVRRAYIKS
ncbi:MAG: NAD kinase [Coprobacillaceae bacterium]